ncbi:hypothetical protein I3843_14G086800 [Carya illinoinensis]|nr:hypothetical protein I3843_14G086800 [Carya illinoinensis]
MQSHAKILGALFSCVSYCRTWSSRTAALQSLRQLHKLFQLLHLAEIFQIWAHPILFPPTRGCPTPSQAYKIVDVHWPQISLPNVVLSTMFSFFLTGDLEERIADLSKNHLKITNNSTPATLTASS